MHDIPTSYADFGCEVNSLSVDQLFRLYSELGFLYPAKVERLKPFWSEVQDNWKKALRGGELILYVVSCELDNGAHASIASWRSTWQGWNTQHMVSNHPRASIAVLSSTQAVRISQQQDHSHQCWFQRKNRFANSVFGSSAAALGPSASWIGDYSYFQVPLESLRTIAEDTKVTIREASIQDADTVYSFACQHRSIVYASAEELQENDLQLQRVDDLYRLVGLRRYRRVLIAEMANELVAIAIIYRGPLGLSFSFLENRCDIVARPFTTKAARELILSQVLRSAGQFYGDLALNAIPVIVDAQYRDCDVLDNSMFVRDYAQSIWLKGGFTDWYRHVESIYSKHATKHVDTSNSGLGL